MEKTVEKSVASPKPRLKEDTHPGRVKKSKKEAEKGEFYLDLEEMAQRGLHLGHKTSKLHPKMARFVFGIRNTIHIINLESTKEEFEKALRFIHELVSQGKILLFVGTKIQFKTMVQEMAQTLNFPYVTERWLGGTFTNFEVIRKRVEHFKELEKKIENREEMEKYTKKERAILEEELGQLRTKFEGIKNLENIPDAVFLLDIRKDVLAIKEARMKGVKIIAISDTNCDPSLVDFPIPANDDAISSVRYILEKVKEVILKTKSQISKE